MQAEKVDCVPCTGGNSIIVVPINALKILNNMYYGIKKTDEKLHSSNCNFGFQHIYIYINQIGVTHQYTDCFAHRELYYSLGRGVLSREIVN